MRRLNEVGIELSSFELVSTQPGLHSEPSAVDFTDALTASAPATVGAALAAAKRLDLDAPPNLDASDHWFRARLPAGLPPGPHSLVFEGLATLADVWLDGAPILRSDSMFMRHEVELEFAAEPGSELVICFRALAPELAKRRPRPRWRTRIVESQQLRWIRTSLIGRTPGFCPNVPVVGPYRPVRLVSRAGLKLAASSVSTSAVGRGGLVRVSATLTSHDPQSLPGQAELVLEGEAGSGRSRLKLERIGDRVHLQGTLELPKVARWWPHTHGAQPRSRAYIEFSDGAQTPPSDHTRFELGMLGFREIQIDTGRDGAGFGLIVNGQPVFARGACWTTDELLTLSSHGARATLELVRQAGMNMLRVGGTTAYEEPHFYALCDELGILVFQDFMFANMDYPADDAHFAAQVEREARELLQDLAPRPCLAVLCGGSEVEQQAAMLGLPRELQRGALFYELLPRLCAELAPSTAYVPSSPSGGELPFIANAGVTHYYGVGAYLRPLDDARRAEVRFAAECLAFANVPCRETIESFMRDLEMPFHHPRWKQRVPRDRGVGWDFEDVRDHYLAELYKAAPHSLRYADPERYLQLSRAVVGEVMAATFDEWRRANSSCRGALIFWLKDFWSGAGWGVIDARGRPKSAYYYLKRCLAPIALCATDEGVNGVALHATNEGAQSIAVELHVRLFRAGEVLVGEQRHASTLAARSQARFSVDGLLERFVDSAYAYRFGPAGHDLVFAELKRAGTEEVLARCFHFPLGHVRSPELDLGLHAHFVSRDGCPYVRVKTRRFAQCVSLDVPGYLPADDFFHLEPRGERLIALVPLSGRAQLSGELSAINSIPRPSIAQQSRETPP